MYVLKEIAELQSGYRKLKEGNKLSKKAICDLCIPFRDKYNLSDSDALGIARSEFTIEQIVEILAKVNK